MNRKNESEINKFWNNKKCTKRGEGKKKHRNRTNNENTVRSQIKRIVFLAGGLNVCETMKNLRNFHSGQVSYGLHVKCFYICFVVVVHFILNAESNVHRLIFNIPCSASNPIRVYFDFRFHLLLFYIYRSPIPFQCPTEPMCYSGFRFHSIKFSKWRYTPGKWIIFHFMTFVFTFASTTFDIEDFYMHIYTITHEQFINTMETRD